MFSPKIGGRELPEMIDDVTLEHRADRSETEEPPDQTAPHGQFALVRDRRSTLSVGLGAQCLFTAVERALEVPERHGGAGEVDLFDRSVTKRPSSTGEAHDSTRLVPGHEVATGEHPAAQPLEHLFGRRSDVHLAAAELDGRTGAPCCDERDGHGGESRRHGAGTQSVTTFVPTGSVAAQTTVGTPPSRSQGDVPQASHATRSGPRPR